MREVNVERDQLLSRLQENRSEHVKCYKESLIGYNKKVAELCEEVLAKVNEEPETEETFKFPQRPISYEESYDEVIQQLEMSSDEIIKPFRVEEFSKYVMNKWGCPISLWLPVAPTLDSCNETRIRSIILRLR